MKKQSVFLMILACLSLSGCQAWERKNQVGAAVEVNGHYLYRSTLDSLTLGLNSEDSLRVAHQYINQWAKDILLYDQAKSHNNPEVERLVEEYRHTLYVHAYEEHLVQTRMPKTILDTTIVQLYNQMPDRFRLDESIVKGIIVIVPIDAPKIKDLRKWLSLVKEEALRAEEEPNSEVMDNIEKYVYQNAFGYELFTDKWLTTSDVMVHIPIERNDLESRIRQRDQIEVSDSTKTYLLQLTEKHMRGEAMPIEYARPEIEKIILNSRQMEFLQRERERLYDEAVQNKRIVFFN